MDSYSVSPFYWIVFLLYLPVLSFSQPDLSTQNKHHTIFVKEKAIYLKNELAGNDSLDYIINESSLRLGFRQGEAPLDIDPGQPGKLILIHTEGQAYRLYHIALQANGNIRLRSIPLWLSVLPPLIAILLALIFKEVVVSLFIGIWAGAFIAGGLRIESLYYFLQSFFHTIEKYVIDALNDSGHLSIIIFSTVIGGMVAIISRNGGMAGVVQRLSRFAQTPRSAQLVTWFLGIAIFFDDYANTLIVGNTMRSVTDRFRISREKLAYIVDSTAAPVAAVAFITTWIGAELSYIDDGVSGLTNYSGPDTPYALFIGSLKYSFYPILTLIFVFLVIYTGRDFGKMLPAEIRARTTGAVSGKQTEAEGIEDVEDLRPVKGAPLHARNAVIPVLGVILMTIYGLLDTGLAATASEIQAAGINLANTNWGTVWGNMEAVLGSESSGFFLKLGKVIGNADSYVALLWASLTGISLAIVMTVAGRIMKLGDTMTTMVTGFKAMVPALLILTLAWALAATTEELHTAEYLTTALQDSLNPFLLPAIIFVLAAFIAFSTGSSWSTMAILYPIAIPITWAICQGQGLGEAQSMELLLNVIATVLAASVLGDHCSPISDTTILSSLASDCNHIDHVRTQLPYALTVGSVAVTATTLSTLMGGGWLISLVLLVAGVLVLWGILRRFGKEVMSHEA